MFKVLNVTQMINIELRFERQRFRRVGNSRFTGVQSTSSLPSMYTTSMVLSNTSGSFTIQNVQSGNRKIYIFFCGH